MTSSYHRPMDATPEVWGTSISQPHGLEGVGEHISNHYVPQISGSELGNHQGVRYGSHLHMCHLMNHPFQQMV